MTKPLSIYIHVPFCEKKCDYCDFYSFVPANKEQIKQYTESLNKEIDLYMEEIKTNGIATVFFGGGTPSMLGSKELVPLFLRLRPYLTKDAEVTMEGNPESVRKLDIAALKKVGLNRFSMGVQSASDSLLRVMGRIHDKKVAVEAFEHLRRGGIENINLDFISSVYGETEEDIEESLSLIESLKPEHISLYSLIVEEGTPFYTRYMNETCDREEEDRRHVHLYERGLRELGYRQYEISNFSKEGFQCRHNLNYWQLGDYLGLGPGASGNLGNIRYVNTIDFNLYRVQVRENKRPIAKRELLSPIDRDNEMTMLGLRLNRGIALNTELPSGGKFQEVYKEEINKNIDDGLLYIKNHHVILTTKGRDLANRVELDFFRLG